jgi:hypothetical protein
MKFSLIHLFLLRGNDSSGGIVQLIIFAVFIVAMVIKNLAIAKKQQNQQQNGPAPRSTAQKAKVSNSSEKARIHQERVEQFLESIFQQKRAPQQKPQISIEQNAQPKAVPPVMSTENKFSSPPADLKFSKIPAASASETALGSSILELPSIDITLPDLIETKEESAEPEEMPAENKQKRIIGNKSTGFLPGFSDSDDLRIAILYSEILGKPISMRES